MRAVRGRGETVHTLKLMLRVSSRYSRVNSSSIINAFSFDMNHFKYKSSSRLNFDFFDLDQFFWFGPILPESNWYSPSLFLLDKNKIIIYNCHRTSFGYLKVWSKIISKSAKVPPAINWSQRYTKPIFLKFCEYM